MSLAVLALLAAAASAADPFTAQPRQTRRDRLVDVLRITVDITPDLGRKSYEASVTHRFKVLADGLPSLTLDASLLDIRGARDEEGRGLKFKAGEDSVTVSFPKPLKEGDEASVRLDYRSTQSDLGLHFFKTDPAYPGQSDQLWSKGETERARFWLPLFDAPQERAATELTAHVPEGFMAVSNGVLAERRQEKEGLTAYRWVQERPHAGYLITLAVGRFEPVVLATAPVPMTVWAPPGRAEDARRTFARTPQMLRYFEELTAVPYPWAKFDQTLLYGFRWGGMEDTSAVMLTDRALLDERASLDEDQDDLISHELAHQWFGDLVTVKDWSQMWLSEGFADYFSALWTRRAKGEDEFALRMKREADWYLGEAYRRPLTPPRYRNSDDLFDAHSYAKGAWVLHRLRFELGDAAFWESLRLYLSRRQDQAVETEDLRQAVEDTTGKPMQEFFTQWVSTPGHPQLTASARWDSEAKRFTLSISQTQDVPFKLSLPVELLTSSGAVAADLPLTLKENVFSWSLPARPKGVRLDPAGTLLASQKWDFPVDWLWALLKSDPSVSIRLRALENLASRASAADTLRLQACVRQDPFWGVAAACAARLGAIGTPEALSALLETTRAAQPKTRRAVAQALGRFLKAPRAFEALTPLAEKDASWFVEAAALQSLGQLRLPQARPLLTARLSQDSHNDVIRRAALSGLGALKDPADLPLLETWASAGKPVSARLSAVAAIASCGAGEPEALRFLTALLASEEDRQVRQATALALGALGDPGAIEALYALAARERDPRIRLRAVTQSVDDLASGRRTKVQDLSARADAFRRRLQDLQWDLEAKP